MAEKEQAMAGPGLSKKKRAGQSIGPSLLRVHLTGNNTQWQILDFHLKGELWPPRSTTGRKCSKNTPRKGLYLSTGGGIICEQLKCHLFHEGLFYKKYLSYLAQCVFKEKVGFLLKKSASKLWDLKLR